MSVSEPDLKPKERRKGADWLMLLLAILNLGAWFLLIMGLALAHLARPEFNSGLVQYWGIWIEQEWDKALVVKLEVLVRWCFVFTAATLVLHQFRNRRRDDGWRLNLFFLLFLSAVVLFIFSTID
ncbi:MAG: hypothetical protein A2203_00550 [Chromatiales bacterium RIFOXYA1_FULL_46_5]|nr:MAG: hypothetical protein A2203_00550 [Chromatiales bacterium RIFOXYA1_FULL_46_5]